MLKKIFLFHPRKIGVWIIWAFGLGFTFIYWQSVNLNLQTDKTDYDIDETIKLILNIESDQQINAWIVQIDWIENFDSFGTANSTSIQNINWQVNMQNKVSFSLKAKQKWDYQIWPAQVQVWTWIVYSNSINIKVFGEKMFIGNKPTNFTNQTSWQTENDQEKNIKTEKKIINSKQKTFIFFFVFVNIFTLLMAGLVLRKYMKNKPKNKTWEKSEKNINRELNQKKIIFPKIDDKNFESKITKILNLILTQKIWLPTQSMTFNEIKNLENRTNLDKNTQENFEKIFELLRIQKYSKNEVDRKEIVEMIKSVWTTD